MHPILAKTEQLAPTNPQVSNADAFQAIVEQPVKPVGNLTGCFNDIDSAVIISSVCKAV